MTSMPAVLAQIGTDPYRLVLALHLLSAILGFGATAYAGVYFTMARRRVGVEARAILRANEVVVAIGAGFIYATFGFGLLLVLMSDDVWRFGATWIWLSIVLWVIIVVSALTLIRPNVERATELLTDEAVAREHEGELRRRSQQLNAMGSMHGVLLLVIIGLMVWRPGQ